MSDKKNSQLEMNFSTAQNRLKKQILFKFVKLANQNICSVCGQEIISEKDLSIEHSIPWLDSKNPKELFWDLDNIKFAHLNCNISLARKIKKSIHPSISAYKKGCRCEECTLIQRNRLRDYRSNKKILREQALVG